MLQRSELGDVGVGSVGGSVGVVQVWMFCCLSPYLEKVFQVRRSSSEG